MVAKGKDASDLFPAVVKNVVSKNIEVSSFKFAFFLFQDSRVGSRLVIIFRKKNVNLTHSYL